MYAPCCEQHNNSSWKLAASDPDQLASDLAAMVNEVWLEKGMPDGINRPVAQAFAKELWSGITKGYGKDLGGIEYDSPDFAMLQNLQNSVYHFSAAKNYQQLKSLTQALIGDDNKLRTFNQFKQAAFQINDEHVNHWLKTEYNTAIASGQMASKWADIKNNPGSRMLEFDAVIDGRTSDICKSLHGVVKPVDDPFWDQWYPPNHYGCRSTVRQRAGTRSTPDDKIVYPEKVPEMFMVNLGKRGLAFPKNHPYFNHVPEKALMTFGDANFKLDTARELQGHGGSVYESGLAYDPTKKTDIRYYHEYNQRLTAADSLASSLRQDVFVLPELEARDWRVKYFFKDVPFPGRYPDFKIDEAFWEMKSYEGKFSKNKISTMLRNGTRQARNLILKVHDDVDVEFIRAKVNRSINDSERMKAAIDKVMMIDHKNEVVKVYGYK